MKVSNYFILILLSIAAACGGSGAPSEALSSTIESGALASKIPDNNTILALAYDNDYTVPTEFFVDDRVETTTRSYSLHHVLDESRSYERCTNDLVIAQSWEQADNDSRAVNGAYVTSMENDRYFEFTRELDYDQAVGNIGDPTSPGYARVFKCDYVDRSGVDRNLLDGYSGRFSTTPVTTQSLQNLVEYLWQFRFFNVSRKAVIASYGSQSDAPLSHTLLLALVNNQGTNQCDRVDVVEWRFHYNVSLGEITREFYMVRSFTAELVDGEAKLCN